jgi:hypothetical protein
MGSIRPFVKKGEGQSTSGMIGLFGLKPFDDIESVFAGMRPGEKLFEELGKLGREGELRRFFNEFLPEARVTETN